jgi:hypothetical protein
MFSRRASARSRQAVADIGIHAASAVLGGEDGAAPAVDLAGRDGAVAGPLKPAAQSAPQHRGRGRGHSRLPSTPSSRCSFHLAKVSIVEDAPSETSDPKSRYTNGAVIRY